MEDKEVGALLSEILPLCGGKSGPGYLASMCRNVIDKLIEDRQTLHWHRLAKRPNGTNPHEALAVALSDFDIDSAEYEKARVKS